MNYVELLNLVYQNRSLDNFLARFLDVPDLSNFQALTIELGIALPVAIVLSIYFYKKQAAITGNQDSILNEVNSLVSKVNDLTTEQSRVTRIIEARRKNRVSWFKVHSLKLLETMKGRYRILSEAVEKYESDPSEENLKNIETVGSSSYDLSYLHAIDIIVNRDLKIAEDYLENTWLIAKLPDVLSLVGDGFARAKHAPYDLGNIKELILLSREGLDSAISEIKKEKD